MTNDDLLRKIYLSTLEILQPLSLEERYKIAIEQAAKITGADYGTIFLGDKKGRLIRVFSNVPKDRKVKPRSEGYTHKALVSGKLYVVPPQILKKIHKEELYDKGVSSLIIIPLSFNRKTVGVLTLQTHNPKSANKLSRNTLNLFGSMISLGIRNSQLYEQSVVAVEGRDLFISVASHELKTPLTTIAAYSDQIAKRVNSKQLPSEKSVEVLNAEVRRLKNLLNELLALDQIRSGELNYEWKDIHVLDVLKRALVNFKFSYPGYKVFVEKSISRKEGLILGDKDKLQQALTNLLNNAAKFSSQLTPIVVSLYSENDNIIISITDYGRGIRKKEQYKIFHEFFKAEGNRKDGMGLGLFLVRSIIEKHGGSISLISKLHKGTTISIKLPQKIYEL